MYLLLGVAGRVVDRSREAPQSDGKPLMRSGLIVWPGDEAPGPLHACQNYPRFRDFARRAIMLMAVAISMASFSRAIGSVRLCSQLLCRFSAAANNSGSTLAA